MGSSSSPPPPHPPRSENGPPPFGPSQLPSEQRKDEAELGRTAFPKAERFSPGSAQRKRAAERARPGNASGGAESTAPPCRGAEPRPGGQHGEQPGGQRAERRGEGGAASLRAGLGAAGGAAEPPLRADGSTHGIPAAPAAVGRGSGAGSPWLHLQSLEGSEARAEQSCWLGRLCPHRPVPVPPSHRPHRPPSPLSSPRPPVLQRTCRCLTRSPSPSSSRRRSSAPF